MSENMNHMINQLSKKLGMSSEQLKSAAQGGKMQDILKNSDNPQVKQAQSILSDPEKTREIMNSPQAQALMKLLKE